ncbi:MAG: DUF222 domain-containing protein, partial [Acidimicrobiia bacterium]
MDVDLEAMLSDEVNQRFLGLVSEVVGLVERVDVGLWSAPAQAEVLVGLLGFQTQIEAVVSQLAGLVDASMFWSTDGSRSAGAWLERQSGRDRKETNQIFRTGRDLREMPETENGFGAGVLSGRHVRVLAKNKVPELFGEAEAMLVEQANKLVFADFVRLVDHWVKVADPMAAEIAAQRCFERRSVFLSSGFDGTGFLDVQFEPFGHERFKTVLERIEQELWQTDWNLAKAKLGDNVTNTDLERSPSQRRYDALIEMANRAAHISQPCPKHTPTTPTSNGVTRGDGDQLGDHHPSSHSNGFNSNHPESRYVSSFNSSHPDSFNGSSSSGSEMVDNSDVVCTCDVTMTRSGRARIAPLITVHIDHKTLTGAICELGSGVPVTPGQALRLLSDVDVLVERAVFNSENQIVDLGRQVRLYTGAARRAIQIRDRHCQYPNCQVPAQYCEVDHIQPWEQGGPTNHQNGQLLCPTHHRTKHKWYKPNQPHPPGEHPPEPHQKAG